MVSAVLMLTAAAVVYFGTNHLTYWERFTPGPHFAPLWAALVSAILGLVLFIQALGTRELVAVNLPDREGGQRVILSLVGLFALLPLLPILGYFVAAPLYVFLMMTLVLRQGLIASLLTTVITVVVIVGLFVWWLEVPMPRGWLRF